MVRVTADCPGSLAVTWRQALGEGAGSEGTEDVDRDPLRKNAVGVAAGLRKADADLLDEHLPDGGHALEAGGPQVPPREPDLDLGLPQLQLQHHLIVPWA